MDVRLRIIAIGGSLLIFGLIIELVRRRKLKEEYSLLWVLTAVGLLALSASFGLLEGITKAIGAVAPTSTLFFFGLMFVILMLLHFSVRISALERRMTSLVQELGLLSVTDAGADASRTSLASTSADAALVGTESYERRSVDSVGQVERGSSGIYPEQEVLSS